MLRPANQYSSHCLFKGTIAHELMHALGLEHEQARIDRDNFVRINYQNIDPNRVSNFDKYLDGDLLGTPYDIYSLMHYAGNAFSINGLPTIESLIDPTIQLLPSSQKSQLTETDVQTIRKLYKFVVPTTTSTTTTTRPTTRSTTTTRRPRK